MGKGWRLIIRAIQVGGGYEFEVVFHECHWQDIAIFVLLPRSTKLNGYVVRARGTHTDEFYNVIESSFGIPKLRVELLE